MFFWLLFSHTVVTDNLRGVMSNIEDLWLRFSLMEEEEQGADVPRKKEATIVHLAAKFFTKRVVNA